MNIAILLAAGSGERMNMDISKQFIPVNDVPLFMYSTKVFNENKNIDSIIIVTKMEDIHKVEDYCKEYNINKLSAVIPGGKTRQESVFNALNYLHERIEDDDVVLIHDTARPLVTSEIIDRNVNALKHCDAVETAIQATDTIVKSKNGLSINEIENREMIYQVQTPQSFKYSFIYQAHLKAREEKMMVTDDASLIIAMNHPVQIVEGYKNNFKITTPEDLEILKALLKKSDLA